MNEQLPKPIAELSVESEKGSEAAGIRELGLEEKSTLEGDAAVAQAIAEGVPGLDDETESRDELDKVVRNMLLAGLAISTILIIAGLLLSSIFHRPLPSVASGGHQLFRKLKAGAPSGFLDLGILVLIATPILRVFGSLAEFIYRRDWLYAAITSTVLLILAISVLAGRG